MMLIFSLEVNLEVIQKSGAGIFEIVSFFNFSAGQIRTRSLKGNTQLYF